MPKNIYKYSFIVFVAIFCFFSFSSLFAQNNIDKLSENLSNKISELNDNDTELVWIYFKDKGKSLNKYFEKPSNVVSPKSLARRAKYYKGKPLIDETDLPVNEDYISQVEKLGIKVKHKTKWFNAISAYVKKKTLDKVAELKFVKSLDLVEKFKVNRVIEKPKEVNTLSPSILKNNSTNVYNYGYSLTALNQLNIPALHNDGYIGTGITIAVMDAGFSNLTHEVFNTRPMKIIAKWDFVNNDPDVSNQADSGEGSHGTATLSIIGGYKEGSIIGPAFDANFILAKTENTDSESPIEEDNWVAAAEWADSIGVDVTSTSLGYRDGFQFGFTDYTSSDMDGNTTIITKAADLLASKGVVVVNSAGNEGVPAPGENTLVAPADGDNVIAVGAVNTSGTLASFSSRGPTADGRIKPDVVATGVGVFFASGTPGNNTGYSFGDGTSFSCPLTAGVAALILQKHPQWYPWQVREALIKTASRANNPDNNYGWGIINAYNASNYNLTFINNDEEVIPDDYTLDQNYPNPFNPTTRIRYQVKNAGFVTLRVFNVLGNEVALLVNREKPAGTYEVQFNAESDGKTLPSGVYFYRLTIGDFVATKKMILAK